MGDKKEPLVPTINLPDGVSGQDAQKSRARRPSLGSPRGRGNKRLVLHGGEETKVMLQGAREKLLKYVKGLVDQAAQHYDVATAHDNTRNLTGAILFYALAAQCLTSAHQAMDEIGDAKGMTKFETHIREGSKTDWCPSNSEVACNVRKILSNNIMPKIKQLQDILKAKRGAELLPQSDKDGPSDAECSGFLREQSLTGDNAVDFKTVVGQHKAKQAITDGFISPLSLPRLYPDMAKGVLLYGPPGTGKTLIAKASIRELNRSANVKALYFHVKAADLKGKFVGESEKNIQKAFRCAALQACKRQHKELESFDPSSGEVPKRVIAVLFMDEVEALAERRTAENSTSKTTVQALLEELDGLSSYKNVVVIAATNLREQLDPAFLRRFQEQIKVDLPDESDVAELLIQSTRRRCQKTARALPNFIRADCQFYLDLQGNKDTQGLTNTDKMLQQEEKQLLPKTVVESDWLSKIIDDQQTQLNFGNLAKRMKGSNFSNADIETVITRAFNIAAKEACAYNSFILKPVSVIEVERIANADMLFDGLSSDVETGRSTVKVMPKAGADSESTGLLTFLNGSDYESTLAALNLSKEGESAMNTLREKLAGKTFKVIQESLKGDTVIKSAIRALTSIKQNDKAYSVLGLANNPGEVVLAEFAGNTLGLPIMKAYVRQMVFPLKAPADYRWTIGPRTGVNLPEKFDRAPGNYVNRAYLPISSDDNSGTFIDSTTLDHIALEAKPSERMKATQSAPTPSELSVMKIALVGEEPTKQIDGELSQLLAQIREELKQKDIRSAENVMALDRADIQQLVGDNSSPKKAKLPGNPLMRDALLSLAAGKFRFVDLLCVTDRANRADVKESASFGRFARTVANRIQYIKGLFTKKDEDTIQASADPTTIADTDNKFEIVVNKAARLEENQVVVIDTWGCAIVAKRAAFDEWLNNLKANNKGILVKNPFDSPLRQMIAKGVKPGNDFKFIEPDSFVVSRIPHTDSHDNYQQMEAILKHVLDSIDITTLKEDVALIDLVPDNNIKRALLQHLPTSKLLRSYIEERATNLVLRMEHFTQAIDEQDKLLKEQAKAENDKKQPAE